MARFIRPPFPRPCRSPLHRIGGLEDYPARNARANFDVVDGAVPKRVQHGNQSPNLFSTFIFRSCPILVLLEIVNSFVFSCLMGNTGSHGKPCLGTAGTSKRKERQPGHSSWMTVVAPHTLPADWTAPLQPSFDVLEVGIFFPVHAYMHEGQHVRIRERAGLAFERIGVAAEIFLEAPCPCLYLLHVHAEAV